MMLAGSAVVLVVTWAAIVQGAGIDPLAEKLVAGLIVSVLLVLVTQYGYRTAPSSAGNMAARGLATVAFAALWGVNIALVTRRFETSQRPFVIMTSAVILFVLGRALRGKNTSNVRFGRDPRGASGLVAPLLLAGAVAIVRWAHPATVKVVWHSLTATQTPAVMWLGVIVGASAVPLVFAALATAFRGRNPTWPALLATFPALGATALAEYLPSGPALYPQSLRIEEQAASLASQWWYNGQMLAAGFYTSTLFLLVAGAAASIGASREGAPDKPTSRQTIALLLGSILVVATVGVWLHWAQYQSIRNTQYDMILLPAAVAFGALAIVHGAAGAKPSAKFSLTACLCALLAMFSFSLAQALPAGSNANVLELGPFEWVLATENLAHKRWSWFAPAISQMIPLGVAAAIALRGSFLSSKRALFPIAPGFALMAVIFVIASRKTHQDQEKLTRVFRAHVPADVTLASGPPGSLTSCNDLALDKILFVGREYVTLHGQTIAAIRDLDSPQVCAEIAERVKSAVPRLAFDETIPFRQTTCLLDAFARRKPRVCNVSFVGRCKAGTRVDNEDIPACTEQLHDNVPLCTEQSLDVEGCPAAEVRGPFVALTPQFVHVVGWNEHIPDPWPVKPTEDDGRWKTLDIPDYSTTTLGVTDDTSMGGFMALALHSSPARYRLQPSTPPAKELPKAPEVVNPLGVRVNAEVIAESKAVKEDLERRLEERKNDLRLCLEPQEIPWFYAVGAARGVFGQHGKFMGMWAMRNPDERFGGCITKTLDDLQTNLLDKPTLVDIRLRAVANLPQINTEAFTKPDGLQIAPPNDTVRSQVSYWSDSFGHSFQYNPTARLATMQCVVPKLFQNPNLHGKVDFDVFVNATEVRVQGRSEDIEADVVTCLEGAVQRQGTVFFRQRFQFLPRMLDHYSLDPAKFQIAFDIAMTMDIRVPEVIENGLSPSP